MASWVISGWRPRVSANAEASRVRPPRAKADDGGDVGDLGDLPPAVGVQQHAAQRLALEHGGDHAGQLGVARLRDRRGGHLGVGLAAGHVRDVDGDEVVRVGLGLLPGQQLLPGVLRDRRDHARGDLSARHRVRERGPGREEDLLRGQLALHGVVHVGGSPQQQAAGHQQDSRQGEPGDRGKTRIAAHRNASSKTRTRGNRSACLALDSKSGVRTPAPVTARRHHPTRTSVTYVRAESKKGRVGHGPCLGLHV